VLTTVLTNRSRVNFDERDLYPMIKRAITAVLVTGAGDRLGLALSQELAERGYAVALHANSKFAQAQAEANALVAKGYRAAAISGDLLHYNDVASLVARAEQALGQPIDGLINNASIFEGDTAQDFTNDSWDRHFDMHVRAPCELARNMALALPEGRLGSVVNIIDQRVFKLTPQFFTYTLSKAALATATKTLAQALAPHVRVNGVAPGPVARNIRQAKTDFQKQVDATILETGSPTPEIVEAVCWILEARTVTGQVIAVDGGQSLIWRTPDVDGIVE
jgi:NAD(P)-dependent dehydrogenase (short-subunit alcohol dehydrogenase family)